MKHFNLMTPFRRWLAIGFLIFTGCLLLWNSSWLRPILLVGEKVVPTQKQAPNLTKDSMNPMGMSPQRAEDLRPAGTKVSAARQQLIGVKTEVVARRALETVIRTVGRVDYDEQRLVHINLRLSGWIKKLLVDTTGQQVRKGQALFTLYSQELVAAQDEYLLAVRANRAVQDSPLPEVQRRAEQLVEAARDRLRLWTFTNTQIQELVRRGNAQTYVTIFSPSAGYVIEKKAFQGMFVEPQQTLYTIADLSTVWIQAEIYEYEVPFVRVGQSANLELETYPGERFSGRVTYVYPYLNQEARTVTVRLESTNPHLRLKPGMYGTVVIQVPSKTGLAVPEQAVLHEGMRTVVFIEREKGLFDPREIRLGSKIGPYYEVLEGLSEGQRIVTSGTFLLDSESKLMTSKNTMGALGMSGMKMEQARMGTMEMGDMKKPMKDTSHD